MRKLHANLKGIAALACALLFSSCATITAPRNVPVYDAFSGRLIVITPKQRWQTTIQWRSPSEEEGWLRLTHAATGRIVELRWQGNRMWVRDNLAPQPRSLEGKDLADQGIPLDPRTLSAFLHGRLQNATRKGPRTWSMNTPTSRIELRWDRKGRRLTLLDAKHGNKALIVIDPRP